MGLLNSQEVVYIYLYLYLYNYSTQYPVIGMIIYSRSRRLTQRALGISLNTVIYEQMQLSCSVGSGTSATNSVRVAMFLLV